MITKTQLADILQFIADSLRAPDGATIAVHSIVPEGTTTSTNAPPVKTPGRPRKTKETTPEANANNSPEPEQQASSPATPEIPGQTAPTLVEKPVESAPVEGAMTREQLVALIDPVVKGEEGVRPPQGLKVKETLNKYAPKDFNASMENQYTLNHLVDHPEHHAAFKKDILALISGTSAESY